MSKKYDPIIIEIDKKPKVRAPIRPSQVFKDKKTYTRKKKHKKKYEE